MGAFGNTFGNTLGGQHWTNLNQNFDYNFDTNVWAYYNPKDAANVSKDGSNLISQITDLSGNNNHLLQATAGNKPTYISESGSKSVRTGDFMQGGSIADCTIYVCATMHSYAANREVFNNGAGVRAFQYGTNPQICASVSWSVLFPETGIKPVVSEKEIWVFQYINNKVTLSKNGGNIYSINVSFSGFNLFKLLAYDITIHEMIIRENEDSYDTILNVVNQLRKDNNITVSEAELIVLAGQSNASGRGPYAEITDVKYKTILTNGYIYDLPIIGAGGTRKMQLLSPTVNNLSDAVGCIGPEQSLLYELADYLNKDIYLAKYAIGGTRIAVKAGTPNDWNVISVNEYYDLLKLRIYESARALQEVNKKARITHIIWMQGEEDSLDVTNANAYEVNLTNFVNGISTYINASNSKFKFSGLKSFVIGKISNSTDWTYRATIRAAQETVAGNIPNAILINTDTYTLLADNKHYNADSQIQFGLDIFNAIKDL